ncbi:lysine-rich nucleolar protein 1 [Salvelinus fontinalis]|uniref:lysine-rich nucleolar protein 1 n=1 Tax=Salvelinus fontinalis TaxID=8038 RepID=UPI002485CFB0|nr:lysine-rich nucleolar protein 1 [Salvelinus fontinalis]XP_055763302.1 lysine-rich nucleolar protein 1 [Salvelinus fontinalis]
MVQADTGNRMVTMKKTNKKTGKDTHAEEEISENTSINQGNNEGVKKKKKTKVETLVEEEQVSSNGEWGNTEEDQEKQKGKKKKLSSGTDINGEEAMTDGNDRRCGQKKKKHKGVNTVKTEVETEQSELKDEKGVVENGPKKKKLSQAEETEISVVKAQEGEVIEIKEGKKKKGKTEEEKKVKKIPKAAEPTEESQEEEEGETKKKKKGKKRAIAEKESEEAEKEVIVKKKKGAEATVAVQEEEQNNTKKKKKKLKSSSSAADTTMETEGKEEGKMKKRKASALAEKEDVMVVDKRKPKQTKRVDTKGVVEQAEDGESEGRKKVKKSSSGVETEMEGSTPHKKGKKIPTKGKKKIKVESCAPEDQERDQTDVVFLSETRGNAFEIHIDQGRRLALQNEIDQKSNPVQLIAAPVPSGLGQWGTAQFDSSDQHSKFLRLMGGFKKGGQPMAASGATGGRTNMALTKDGQQSLQQGLLGEFERAQSRRMDFTGRGAGLGFSASSNKKFSIDINKTRSVRFDD